MKFKKYIKLTDKEKRSYFEAYKKKWIATRNN